MEHRTLGIALQGTGRRRPIRPAHAWRTINDMCRFTGIPRPQQYSTVAGMEAVPLSLAVGFLQQLYETAAQGNLHAILRSLQIQTLSSKLGL